jgi:inosine/xanthosine triphosphate pyrophosphatase family protein
MTKIAVTYNTTSEFKRQEVDVLKTFDLNGTRIGDLFEFRFTGLRVQEDLEVDLVEMVKAEARKTYASLRIPCFVEHAGLVFDKYADKSYPGGLTKPMWNTLEDEFVKETGSAGKACTAKAVIGYCDGMAVHTFVGEAPGRLAAEPKGNRKFYWDTIFIPDEENPDGLTYAEIVDRADLGLARKMKISQSGRAMLAFLKYRLHAHPHLWQQQY